MGMRGLVLKPGATLEFEDWVIEDLRGNWLERIHVGAYAIAYVIEPVELKGELYVRDLIELLGNNSALIDMFSRFHAREIMADARKGPGVGYSAEYDPAEIEYLELFYDWQESTATGALHGTHRLWLRGVGYELLDDCAIDGWGLCKRGTRPHWNILGTPVAQVLNLPLRIETECTVCDHDHVNDVLHTYRIPRPTLAQVLHGFLAGLSWTGAATDET
jgi:hypothetical protein